eukprot:SAG31_NODE_4519_length_3163_cov_3.686096_2_plen_254_part_01
MHPTAEPAAKVADRGVGAGGGIEGAQLPTLQDDILSQALAMGGLQFGVAELWRAAHTAHGTRKLALKAAWDSLAALGWQSDLLPTGLDSLCRLARLASARVLEGLVIAAPTALAPSAGCDVSSATCTFGNWFHKSGEQYDLCCVEYRNLCAEEQAKYTKIDVLEDLGDDLEDYWPRRLRAEQNEQDARLRRLLAAFGATVVASDAPNADFCVCHDTDDALNASRKPLISTSTSCSGVITAKCSRHRCALPPSSG